MHPCVDALLEARVLGRSIPTACVAMSTVSRSSTAYVSSRHHRTRTAGGGRSGRVGCRNPMCFSAEADLCTGIIVGAVGIDALRHVRKPHQIALAVTPILFALHEIDESFVWWGLHGQVSYPVEHAAIYVFLAVAFVLPLWVPLAMLGVETKLRRRQLMAALLVVGTLTTVALLVAIVQGPVGASIDGSHIAYSADISYAGILIALYI